MAIDKSRTPKWMKGVIIFIALSFVLSIGGVAGLSSCSAGQLAQQQAQQAAAGASVGTTQSVDAIALKYTPVIKSLEASLTADPKNYDILVAQAQAYYGWGQEVQQALQSASTGQDTPIWKAASTYYTRALALNSSDSGVMGDYAVTLFYSGETTAAIAQGEKTKAADPKLGQNLFNLGIFYDRAGDSAKATAAFEAYLAAEPNGELAQDARDNIATLATP